MITRPHPLDWRPILDHDLRSRGWRIVQDVCSDLLLDHSSANACSCSEQALLFAYMAMCSGEDKWDQLACERLTSASDLVFKEMSNSLFGGLSDFGWNFEHASRMLAPNDSDKQDDLLADLDILLLSRLEQSGPTDSYDLVDGQVGIGVYFLERRASRTAAAVSRVAAILEHRSERGSEGATWRTPPNVLPEYQRKQARDGYYNLGVAHGVPGILYFLAQAAALGIETPNVST